MEDPLTSKQITLTIPRSKTEALFLRRVIQAAIQAYRNGNAASIASCQDASSPYERVSAKIWNESRGSYGSIPNGLKSNGRREAIECDFEDPVGMMEAYDR